MGEFDETIVYIIVAVVVDLLLLGCCFYKIYGSPKVIVVYGKPKVPEGKDPKEFAIEELEARAFMRGTKHPENKSKSIKNTTCVKNTDLLSDKPKNKKQNTKH